MKENNRSIDLGKVKNVHIIGIGGIGVSSVARMFFEEGKRVTGNDIDDFYVCKELRTLGIPVHIGVERECIPNDVDLIVYSRGWDTINPDFLNYAKDFAKNLGKHILSYPETLKIISANKYTIAVSGAHGKTTTTAMIGSLMLDAELDPTIVVGSIMAKTKSNFVSGKSEYFVVEADEYRRSFLNLYPSILIITNIDDDHLDYYKDIADIQSAFREMIERVPAHGYIICDPSSKNMAPVLAGTIKGKIIDFTKYLDQCDFVKGAHNRRNASCAIAVANILGIDEEIIKKSLMNFQGTWRRFEYKGKTTRGILVYDDYAHHPTEVLATLLNAREQFPDRQIHVLFQPHLYSRTRDHLDSFVNVFANNADKIYMMPIYGAREAFDPTISSEMIVDKINQIKTSEASKAVVVPIDVDLPMLVDENFSNQIVFITMGAGDVYKIGEEMVAGDLLFPTN